MEPNTVVEPDQALLRQAQLFARSKVALVGVRNDRIDAIVPAWQLDHYQNAVIAASPLFGGLGKEPWDRSGKGDEGRGRKARCKKVTSRDHGHGCSIS